MKPIGSHTSFHLCSPSSSRLHAARRRSGGRRSPPRTPPCAGSRARRRRAHRGRVARARAAPNARDAAAPHVLVARQIVDRQVAPPAPGGGGGVVGGRRRRIGRRHVEDDARARRRRAEAGLDPRAGDDEAARSRSSCSLATVRRRSHKTASAPRRSTRASRGRVPDGAAGEHQGKPSRTSGRGSRWPSFRRPSARFERCARRSSRNDSSRRRCSECLTSYRRTKT